MSSNQKTLWKLFYLSLLLIAIGTVGLAKFEPVSYSEAFYQTILIMLSHFDHYGFHSANSRKLIVLLILGSLVIVAYLLKWFAEYMIGIGDNVKRRKVKAKVAKMHGHYIVCGLGRVGSQVALELVNEKVPFVGVDRDQERVNEAIAQGYMALCLDSTDEESLKEAGIERASGLVASLGEDSHNLFVTLAARSLNPNLYIVARANRKENEVKLQRAGADRVAMPYQIGGYHMASMVLRPNVVDYMDIMSNGHNGKDLAVEEMVVMEQSKLAGQHLGRTLTDESVGATVIAINGADGVSRVRPTGQEMIYPGDRLIVLGSKQALTDASALIR